MTKEDIIKRLTPAMCIDNKLAVLEWLDRVKEEPDTCLSFLPEIQCSPIDSVTSYPKKSTPYKSIEPKQTHQEIDGRLMSFETIKDMIRNSESGVHTGKMNIISNIKNPTLDIVEYVIAMYPMLVKHMDLNQDLVNYLYEKGTLHPILMPKRFVTDEMIEKEWYESELSKHLREDEVSREDKIALLLDENPCVYHSDVIIRVCDSNVRLLSHYVYEEPIFLEYMKVSPELYQKVVLHTINEYGLRYYYFVLYVKKDKCSDYDEICNAFIAADPHYIFYLDDPSYTIASYAMDKLGNPKYEAPGTYKKYPPEFLETWPWCVTEQEHNEEDWLTVIRKHPDMFYRCKQLSENIIRCGLAYCA